MEVNYINSDCKSIASDINIGGLCRYKGFNYMRIRLSCDGLQCITKSHKAAFVNLKSGTIRLIEHEEEVNKLKQLNKLKVGIESTTRYCNLFCL